MCAEEAKEQSKTRTWQAMAQGHHDSSFELTFVPISGGGSTAPLDADAPQPGAMPVLDLDSSGPLPADLPEVPLPGPPEVSAGESLAAAAFDRQDKRRGRAPGSLWLQGDVVMCACPDCSAPMSVRMWLMIADCWQCGTSIELSEEQEREARRLLKEREEAAKGQAGARKKKPAATPATNSGPARGQFNGAGTFQREAAPHGDSGVAKTTTDRRRHGPQQEERPPGARPSPTPGQRQPRRDPTQRPAHRQAASKRPVGVRAKIRKMAVAGSVQVWIHDFFRNLPAWLVSLVFHVVLLTILGLLMLDESGEEPDILLATEISPEVREGGDPEAQLAKDEVKFDLPVPSKDWLENEQRREVLIKADQEARTLRLDPNDPTPDLPPVAKVKQALRSKDTVRRTFSARDPRIRVEMVKAEGGTTLTEAAVARALRWISQQQNRDGGWGLRGSRSDAAGTSLALLPFLGAGQTHQTGIYKDNVSLGLRWMIQHQSEDGDLRHSLRNDNAGMYAHGQGAIVLCEAFALTGDEQLRGPAQQAIDFIINAQHEGGGWRYQPGQRGDTSVLGWQLMALHSARVSGLDVPETTVELAGQFLDTVQSDGGAKYAYIRGRPPSDAMTAEGLLCRMYTGWTKRNPALEKGLDFLMDEHMPHIDRPNIYYWYYGTQVAHHIGGRPWQRWNMRMRDVLVSSQDKEGRDAGSWAPRGGHASRGGRIYMTSLATCSLEVYYRHTPLFRQIELDEDSSGSGD